MRVFLKLTITLLCIQLTGTCLAELSGSKPNIILVITDDQGYPLVGKHGHPWIKTPHLDQLHDSSTRFTQFMVSPTCAPTRAALLTGRHPMRNGITHTILERERMALDAVTLPQVLANAGYKSGIFGNGTSVTSTPTNQTNAASTKFSFTVRAVSAKHTHAHVPTLLTTNTLIPSSAITALSLKPVATALISFLPLP